MNDERWTTKAKFSKADPGCPGCGEPIIKGQWISRVDGIGWLHKQCAEDDLIDPEIEGYDDYEWEGVYDVRQHP